MVCWTAIIMGMLGFDHASASAALSLIGHIAKIGAIAAANAFLTSNDAGYGPFQPQFID